MDIHHIFFDLDRTLWDFETNSEITLIDIIKKFKLTQKGVPSAKEFIARYKIHNELLWGLYRQNKISKTDLRSKRFFITLQEYNINDKNLSEKIGTEYIKKSPLKTNLFPFSIEVLDYLYDKYNLHIITNGFKEVQHTKLLSSHLDKYFQHVITSEEVGVKKPEKKIFDYALNRTNAKANESIMIGDDLMVDIIGSENAGIKGVYFNPESKNHNENISYEISCLSELMQLL